MSAGSFDYHAFREAFEAKDAVRWASFYTDDAEYIEYDSQDFPPSAPVRRAGKDAILAFFQEVEAMPIELRLEDEVLGTERIAFAIMCSLPDGKRIIEHAIAHLDGGRIKRQVNVDASD
jgi:ketosteroid isomerase-like protein